MARDPAAAARLFLTVRIAIRYQVALLSSLFFCCVTFYRRPSLYSAVRASLCLPIGRPTSDVTRPSIVCAILVPSTNVSVRLLSIFPFSHTVTSLRFAYNHGDDGLKNSKNFVLARDFIAGD